MDKTFARWYDNDKELAQLFLFLESISPQDRKSIANEILQIVFCELKVDVNKKVAELKSLEYAQNKRWYDADIDVQSAVELLKTMPKNQRRELVLRVIETLHQIVAKGGF